MAAGKAWREVVRLSLMGLGVAAASASLAAGQGTTTGVATFQAKGEVKEFKPGVLVWDGSFVGVSIADGRKGPLHNAGWECTGESVLQDGRAYRSGGFCRVTDPDGDTINLFWERLDVPGEAAKGNNKGTYLSGTGKYTGIKGHYEIACRLNGALAICNLSGGEYTIP